MKMKTYGRTDIEEYFKLSGVLDYKELKHTPFLVFEEKKLSSIEDKLKRALDDLEKLKEEDSYGMKSIVEESIEKIKKEVIEFEEGFEVKVVSNKDSLLRYPDETKVMGQWRGEWRSDFFQFTVGDVRKFLEARKEKNEDYSFGSSRV